MKATFRLGSLTLVALWTILAVAQARAEEKVTLSDMHVCCQSCVNAIQKAVAKVPGAHCVASEDDSNTVITADNKETLQKAVDALVKAGFSGTPDNKEIKIAEIKVPEGKVQSLEITHVHNCCGKCTAALKDVLKDVKGVTGSTLESKKTSFMVQGDFEPGDVVKALVKAGFYPELKTEK